MLQTANVHFCATKWTDGLWSNIVCAFKSLCCASDLDWTASWGGSFKDRLLWAARGPFVLPPLSMLAFLHTDTKRAHALPKACSPLEQFPFRHPTSWLSVCFSFPLCNAATNTLRSGRRFVVSVVSNMYVVFQSLNGPKQEIWTFRSQIELHRSIHRSTCFTFHFSPYFHPHIIFYI